MESGQSAESYCVPGKLFDGPGETSQNRFGDNKRAVRFEQVAFSGST